MTSGQQDHTRSIQTYCTAKGKEKCIYNVFMIFILNVSTLNLTTSHKLFPTHCCAFLSAVLLGLLHKRNLGTTHYSLLKVIKLLLYLLCFISKKKTFINPTLGNFARNIVYISKKKNQIKVAQYV